MKIEVSNFGKTSVGFMWLVDPPIDLSANPCCAKREEALRGLFIRFYL